jgi:endo-1,4-beta-xylanase
MQSRRTVVKGAIQTVALWNLERVLTGNAVGQVVASPSLRSVAAQKGRLFGSAVQQSYLSSDDGFSDLFSAQCGILVPEAELKWSTLRPTPSTFNFAPSDWLLAYATRNQMKMRGHTLVWYRSLPKWFAGYASAANAKQLLLDHIEVVVGHFAGKMHSWDVVNEVLYPEHNIPGGWRDTPWLKFLGPDYIELAFRAAGKADPHALLVWNEDHIEDESDGCERKRTMFLQQLQSLLRKGVPIGGIGIQSHLIGGQPEVGGPKFRRFLAGVSGLGLKILITEMDVQDGSFVGDLKQRDKQVAEVYERYLTTVLQNAFTVAVLTWGLSDKYTWLKGFAPRSDGLDPRPLPFDASFNPTETYSAICKAFQLARPI